MICHVARRVAKCGHRGYARNDLLVVGQKCHVFGKGAYVFIKVFVARSGPMIKFGLARHIACVGIGGLAITVHHPADVIAMHVGQNDNGDFFGQIPSSG